MRYRVATTIHKPLDDVIKEFRNVDAAYEWMTGLKEFKHVTGELDSEGSTYQLVFDNKGKEQTMIETIVLMNPPKNITTKYEMGKVVNTCINKFLTDNGNTIYIMDTEFQFEFPLNIFMPLFKPLFKKESQKGLNAFRDYMEKEKE